MPRKAQVSSKNILRLMAQAGIYGKATEASPLSALKSHLLLYQDVVTAAGGESVTRLAISNWFLNRKPSHPTHATAKHFLRGYLSWLGRSKKFSGEQQQLVERIIQYLESTEPRQSKLPAKGGATETWGEQDHDTLLQFRALEGTYQVIRPYSVEPGTYVLEPLAIEVDEGNRSARVRMYSHNQRASDLVYSGGLYASYHYGFSLIRRLHESNPKRFALRCITFFVAIEREGDGYLSQPCLSGLISRGVAGIVGPTRMMAAPFIALKAPGHSSDFSSPDFKYLKNGLRRLHKKGDILVGQVTGSEALPRLCHQIFSKLKRYLTSGLVLYAVQPERIEAAIMKSSSGGEKDVFSVWSAAVKAHLADKEPQRKTREKRKRA